MVCGANNSQDGLGVGAPTSVLARGAAVRRDVVHGVDRVLVGLGLALNREGDLRDREHDELVHQKGTHDLARVAARHLGC